MAHSDFGLRMAGIAHLNFCPFPKLSKMTRKTFFFFFPSSINKNSKNVKDQTASTFWTLES